jgi:UDP-N-acetylglucosamine acyltransferase
MKTFIHPTAIIYDNVSLGENVYIGPYCVIGAPPEHPALGITDGIGVVICEGAVLHKAVVVDSGTKRQTYIGPNVTAMSGVHVGHDAFIASGAILAPKAMIGGHVNILSQANIGMGAAIHQNCEVPVRSMIGMGAVVTKAVSDRMNYCETWAGNPARKLGMNKKYCNEKP